MLITPNYRAEQERLHGLGNYGTVGATFAPLVSEIANRLEIKHLLDYGCGANTGLLKKLKVDHKLTYQAYDPGVPQFSEPPVPAEFVCCIDVLEHIEPDCLDDVLDDLARVTEVVGFFTICTGPAHKTLSDGRNAHLIQQPATWWLPKLWERFEIQSFQVVQDNAFYVVVYAKPRYIEAANGEKL